MDEKTKILIAVGASVTANCQPCLKTAIAQAEAVGAEKKEIIEAIAIGRLVRRGATGKMDKFAQAQTGKNFQESSDDCPLGSTEKDYKEWVNQEDACSCS
jgi:AhpD family alkylhydroperoxidase